MKHFFTILLIATAASFSSCKIESNMSVSDLAIYMSGAHDGHSPYFVMADSTLTYTSNGFDSKDVKNGSLITLIWNYYSDTQGKATKIVEVSGYELVPQQTAFYCTNQDTLGRAPADIYSYKDIPYLYKMGGVYEAPVFLYMGFYYSAATTESGEHIVRITYENEQPDQNGYFNLKFSHKAGKDTTGIQQSFYAFKLPQQAYAPNINGVIIQFDGIGEERSAKYYRFTYATGKAEPYTPPTKDALPELSNR